MMYTVFIGGWDDDGDHDWISFKLTGQTWDAAKAILLEHFRYFEDDDCEPCREAASEAVAQLMVCKPGAFDAEVDGNDYKIIPDQVSTP